MSVFSTWLRDEMVTNGYGKAPGDVDKRQFAEDLGVVETTVQNWLENDGRPNLRGVLLIARMLGHSTEYVMERAGYDIVPSVGNEKRDERKAHILASIPKFARILEKIADQPPEKQDVWLSVIEKLMDELD